MQESCYCARELLLCKRAVAVEERYYCARELGFLCLFVKQFIQFSLIYLQWGGNRMLFTCMNYAPASQGMWEEWDRICALSSKCRRFVSFMPKLLPADRKGPVNIDVKLREFHNISASAGRINFLSVPENWTPVIRSVDSKDGAVTKTRIWTSKGKKEREDWTHWHGEVRRDVHWIH